MKTSMKVFLAVVVVLVIGLSYSGYRIYQVVNGSEELVGARGNIPAPGAGILPLTVGSSDWPNWRGTNFDGKSAALGIVTNWAGGLKKAWQVDYLCQDQATASWSAPVIQGNRLVVPGRNRKQDLLFCLNSGDGSLMWMGSYDSAAGSSHGPGSRATPFIDDGRVYTFGRSGDLACWQLLDGKLLWRKNVKEVGGVEPQWGYSGTPLVMGDKVIVQGGGKALVVAYDKMSGAVIWNSLEGDAGYSASIPAGGGEREKQVLVYHAKALSCLSAATGKELWSAPWETKYGVNATTPAVENSIVFHSSNYKMGCRALEMKKDGYAVLWKNEAVAAHHSDPVIINGYVYGYSGDSSSVKGQFKCLELKTGKEMWSTGLIGQGTTTFADGVLICLDIKGNLYFVKPDPSGFRKLGEMKQALGEGKPAWTVPVVANGKLYLRYLQRLVCYNLTL